MKYTIKEISAIIKSKPLGLLWDSYIIEQVEIDSRHILNPEISIFFALRGSRTNGHHFISDVVSLGVKVFVVEKDYTEIHDNACFFKVDSPLFALQELARYHRSTFHIPVIAITGSNGKTIVKEWLSDIFRNKYRVCKNPKSFNSQLGVALSLLELNESHEIAFFEAGISRVGEMTALQDMIQPTHGLITNIGDAHQAGFISLLEKTEEKISLFDKCIHILYCKDYPTLKQTLETRKGALSWSSYQEADLRLEERNVKAIGSQIRLMYNQSEYSFKLPFNDFASIENAIHCIFCSLLFGIEPEIIQKSLLELYGLPMRMEQKEGVNGCLLMNDSYSLDLKSLQLAVQFVEQQNQSLSRTIVISDFLHHEDKNIYAELAEILSNYRFTKIIGVGNRIVELRNYLSDKQTFFYFQSTEQLLQEVDSIFFQNELILIKGARQFRLEKLFNELSLSNHDTILEIDLKAISQNLTVYKQKLKQECKIMAIVKAAAYGSGHYEVARLLEHKKVDYLAVAYPDEGILLREKGIQAPIMVMNCGTANFNDLRDFTLEPELFSINQGIRLIKEIGKQTPFNIHLKLDTGMHRLGFQESDVDVLLDWLQVHKNVKVKSIFSHLSASDQTEFERFTKLQVRRFEMMYQRIVAVLNYRPIKHILNSGGIAKHPDFQFDMIRIGIGLYGIDGNIGQSLEKAHRLKTRITQIKKIAKGETISYNLSGRVDKDSQIAILSIGYADGLPRNVGLNGYKVFCRDRFAPILGLVCMDMCMIDISEIPDLYEGMEVEIFGPNASIENLAKTAGTIPYEILSGISTRVKRIFLQD